MSHKRTPVTLVISRNTDTEYEFDISISNQAVARGSVTLTPGSIESLHMLDPRARRIAEALLETPFWVIIDQVTFGLQTIRPRLHAANLDRLGMCLEVILQAIEDNYGDIARFYLVQQGLTQRELDELSAVMPLNLTRTFATHDELLLARQR